MATLEAFAASWAEAMVRACWQGALFVTLAALVCRFVRRLSPSIRALLWLTVSAKLVVGLAWYSPPTLRALPAAAGTVTNKPEQWRSTAEFDLLSARTPTHAGAARELVGSPFRTYASSTNSVPHLSSTSKHASMKWSTVLFGLWALGLVVGSFSLIVRLRRLTRMIRIARPINDPEIERVARQVAVGLGLFGLPDVLVSHSGSGPLAAWLGRPVILLPESALASLPAAELRMALAHETAHFQRHDIWTAFVPTLSQLLFFFFPPAWIAAREFSIAREQACDAAAIRLCGAAPADYGLFLLRFVSVPSVRIAALGSTPTYRTLERRMKMLPYVPVSRPRRGAIPVMALVSIVALIPFKLAAQDVAGARKSDKPVIAAQAPTSHPSADTAPAVAQEAAAAPKPAQPVKAVGRRGTDVKPVRAQAPATLAAVPAPTAVVGSADNVQGIAAPVSQSPAADIARAAPAPLVKPIDAAIEAQNLTPAPQAGSTHAATQPTTPIYGVTLSPPAQNRVQARPSNGIYLSRAARNGVPMTPTAGTPPQELTIRASQARTRNRGQSADIVADMQKAVVQRLPNGQVSLEMDGANLLRALKELFRAADADFKIDQEAAEIAGRTRVFMQLRSASVGKALDLLLSAGRGSDSRLSYRVEGGVYIVIPSDGPRRR